MGWYHTGPRLREGDLDINTLMANYCDNPLLLICEVQVGQPPPGAGWALPPGAAAGRSLPASLLPLSLSRVLQPAAACLALCLAVSLIPP